MCDGEWFRDSEKLFDFTCTRTRGISVIIAGAGGAAHYQEWFNNVAFACDWRL
jgi:phosphoribosylcarboxyaminoimidazole (NCAIR) mutase